MTKTNKLSAERYGVLLCNAISYLEDEFGVDREMIHEELHMSYAEYDAVMGTNYDFANTNEEIFLEKLEEAEAYIPGGYDMEIDHVENCWFVMKYSEEHGEATETDYPAPIITDEEAKAEGIDVVKCLEQYGCYYVA